MKAKSNQNAERFARIQKAIQRLKTEHYNVVGIDEMIMQTLLPRLNAIPNPAYVYAEVEDCFLAAAEAGQVVFRGQDGKFVSAGKCNAETWTTLLNPPKPMTAAEKETKRINSLSAEEYAREFPPETEVNPRDVAAVKQAMATVLANHPQIMLSGPEGRSNIRKFQEWFEGKRVSTQAAKNCIDELLAQRALMTDSTLIPTQANVTRYIRGEGHPEPTAVIALVNDGTVNDSLRAEIKRMSADELRERLSSDETFADAVNNL